MGVIKLIYTAQDGQLYTDDSLLAVGLNGKQAEVADQTWIDLPSGGEILTLPGRLPMGFNEQSGELEVLEQYAAVAAILPVGLTRALTPGYEIGEGSELPLLGYTAVGAANGKLKVAAIQTDDDLKWNPIYYNTTDLPGLIDRKCKLFPDNRILRQLAKCSIEYHCLTAQNIFYERWEAGIPVSPVCNARCLGCISEQPAECCPSPQGRINFVPSEQEIVELAIAHLDNAADAIFSFGQGCEGEPSLQSDLLFGAIAAIRAETRKGTININSNAGNPDAIKKLAEAGLDSIRVSLFSAIPENYQWYHRPSGYDLIDVKKSLHHASEKDLMISVNLLFFPGFTNRPDETEALVELIRDFGIRQIQLRNLNIDPERLHEILNDAEMPTVREWIANLQQTFPALQIGNYSKPIR